MIFTGTAEKPIPKTHSESSWPWQSWGRARTSEGSSSIYCRSVGFTQWILISVTTEALQHQVPLVPEGAVTPQTEHTASKSTQAAESIHTE